MIKKDHIRDYATEAFRFYARTGGARKYIDNLIAQAKREKGSGIANPTEATLMIKERILAERAAEFADLEAVEKTLHIISALDAGKDMRNAIEIVYFERCWDDLRRGDIQSRVHKAELTIPASERQIYRWLKTARLIFARERGLRL